MATLTKKEQAWLSELQDVLDRCPSPKKIGFYTIGDKSIYLYDLICTIFLNDFLPFRPAWRLDPSRIRACTKKRAFSALR